MNQKKELVVNSTPTILLFISHDVSCHSGNEVDTEAKPGSRTSSRCTVTLFPPQPVGQVFIEVYGFLSDNKGLLVARYIEGNI